MLPIPEHITYEPEVQEKYDVLISRRQEIDSQLIAVDREENEILINLGEQVAKGSNYKKQVDRLAALRLESEALHEGVRYLNNQRDLLKRINTWLR
jgi:hypothetical protein